MSSINLTWQKKPVIFVRTLFFVNRSLENGEFRQAISVAQEFGLGEKGMPSPRNRSTRRRRPQKMSGAEQEGSRFERRRGSMCHVEI